MSAFVTVWAFQVAPAREPAFLEHYAPDGSWARLFRRDSAYLGTELLRDLATPGRFVTLDRWASATAYRAFRARHAGDYAALDAACERLTEREEHLGDYHDVPAASR